MKNLIVFFIIIIFFSSCKKDIKNTVSVGDRNTQTETLNSASNNNLQGFYKSDKEVFLGDSVLAIKNYFENLNNNTGYVILKKQNELYLKNYSNFLNNDIPQISSSTNIKLKFEKQLFKSKNEYRIVLYTFLNDKKIDSVEFYRNVTALEYEPSSYTNLSYLNLKNGKIWQIKYFSSPVDKSIGYIFYGRKEILQSGKVETDSLYYLDESLDVEMEKNKLYYN